jgi:pimeloyl-ACP methyl ester carboxylesterase
MKLIYLHGFASGPQSSKAQYFRRRFEELGMEMQIPDLNEGAFESLTLSGQLRVIERVAQGDDDVRLIGSSMGGYLAALYAARRPEVTQLVLLAPAFNFARRWRDMLGAEKVDEWRRTGWLPVYHYGEKVEQRVGYSLLEDADQCEDYPDVSQPVLIFHGSHDDVVPPGLSRRFAELRPQTALRILDSDHQLLNVLEEMWTEIRSLQ